MIDDVFVIDATVHSFNLAPSNVQDNRWARSLQRCFYEWHEAYALPGSMLPEEQYLCDWSAEALTEVLFLESQTDMGTHHVLRMDSWFKDGLVSFEKNLEIYQRWPNRFQIYLGVDPTVGLSCINELRAQKEQIPTAIGLKIYPAQVDPYRPWRADDREMAFPLFEAAQELGLKQIAFHKALAVLGVPTAPYRIDDIEGAAYEFPDLNFEIVHAGTAFLEDTAHAIGRFENVFANLEITSLLATVRPHLFDEIMATMVYWGGVEKLLYATGSMEWHCQPVLEAFWNYQISEDMQRRFSMRPLTREDKVKMLGENYARLIGLDTQAAKARLADDGFARKLAAEGLAPEFSHWRKRMSAMQATLARS
jgi:predicted TIM-barrel fold metal-dependent hydrolase